MEDLISISTKLLIFARNLIHKLNLVKNKSNVIKIGDILKEHMQITKIVWSFFLHIFTTFTAYQIRDEKPNLSATVAQN